MSQSLTQPEEIDFILHTLAPDGLAPEATKTRTGEQGRMFKKTVQSTETDTDGVAGNISTRTRKAKSTHGFSEAYPYVWSM